MKRIIVLAGLCSAMLGLLPGSAHAFLPLFEQRTGDWVLGAHTQADVGPFAYCSLRKVTANPVTFVFVIGPNGAWRLALEAPGWTLAGDATAAMTYRIDGGRPRTGQAISIGTTTIALPLPVDNDLFDEVAAAKMLHLEFNGQSLQLDLDGAAVALPTMIECVRRFRGQSVAAVAPGPAPAVADLRAATNPTLEAAARWARQITADGAMLQLKPLTSAEMTQARWGKFFKIAVAGWSDGNILGRLEVYQPAPITLSDTAKEKIEPATRKCDGDFTYTRGGRDDRVIGIYIDCTVGGQRVYRASVLFKDKNGFLHDGSFLGATGVPAEDVEPVAENFRRAALALLAQQ